VRIKIVVSPQGRDTVGAAIRIESATERGFARLQSGKAAQAFEAELRQP